MPYGGCGKNSEIIVMWQYLLSCLFSTDGNSTGCLVHQEDHNHYPDSGTWFLQSHHSPILLNWNCLQYHKTKTQKMFKCTQLDLWPGWLQMAQQFWSWCWQTVHSLCSLSWGSIVLFCFFNQCCFQSQCSFYMTSGDTSFSTLFVVV